MNAREGDDKHFGQVLAMYSYVILAPPLKQHVPDILQKFRCVKTAHTICTRLGDVLSEDLLVNLM